MRGLIVLLLAGVAHADSAWTGRSIEYVAVTDSSVTIFYHQISQISWGDGSPPPNVWKDVFKVRKGKIVKDTTIYAQVTQNPPETVTWPDEK